MKGWKRNNVAGRRWTAEVELYIKLGKEVEEDEGKTRVVVGKTNKCGGKANLAEGSSDACTRFCSDTLGK
jgi:hypothetical protein